MSLDLIILPPAQVDIDAITAYLDDDQRNAGDRFLDDLSHVLDRITTFPQAGPLHPVTHPELSGLRRIVLRSFPVSVFYRVRPAAIEIIRVLHQARDLKRLLETT